MGQKKSRNVKCELQLTSRKTTISCTQESPSPITRKPSLKVETRPIRSRYRHADTTNVCQDDLGSPIAGRIIVWEGQVCAWRDKVDERDCCIGNRDSWREWRACRVKVTAKSRWGDTQQESQKEQTKTSDHGSKQSSVLINRCNLKLSELYV